MLIKLQLFFYLLYLKRDWKQNDVIHLVFHLTHFDFWIAAQADSWPCQSADVRHDGGLTGGDGGDVGDGDGDEGGDDDGGDGDGCDGNGGDGDDDDGPTTGDDDGDVDDDGCLIGQNQSQAVSNPNCNKISIWS